ncbi:MAG: RagB/SusD family nutrient uptake outer membrane protein [Prevotellaceae bacterium]|jgi:hypothetical protein|nr:RagB/SusD family nutrient uptake outer membrane protein [Prevotellaceae bacterium]
MKKAKQLKVLLAAGALAALGQCSVEPTYFSEVTDEVYSSGGASTETAQIGVWQTLAVPFDHLRDRNGNVPLVALTASNTLSSDEILMPNRNGDWYDGGFYLSHWQHKWTASTDGYWVDVYDAAVMQGVVKCWDTYKRLEAIDFDAIGFEPGTKEWMRAQVRATIAYLYLAGLDHFGGMPLYKTVEEGTSDELFARSTDKETFEFIEQTLKDVLPDLKQNTEAFNGFFTQGAAAALLARLYFNARPYIDEDRDDDCKAVCEKIKSGEYGSYYVEPDYRTVFGWNNEYSAEFIFGISSAKSFREVHGGRPEYATHYNTMVYLDNKEALSWNGLCLSPSLDMDGKNYRTESGKLGGPFKLGCPYAKFEENDVRKQNYLYQGGGKYEGMFLAGKLINPITGGVCTADGTREYPMGDTIAMVDQIAQICPHKTYPAGRFEGAMFAEENSGVRLMKLSPIPNDADNATRYNPDVPLIRYTEIEFMLAEIAFNKGDKSKAAEIINDVRARYFTTTGGDPNPVPSDFDKYRLADEWLIEFLGEGRRRTDLVRWGMYTTEPWWDHPADGPGQEFRNRFPIYQDFMAANSKLEQNPGY